MADEDGNLWRLWKAQIILISLLDELIVRLIVTKSGKHNGAF